MAKAQPVPSPMMPPQPKVSLRAVITQLEKGFLIEKTDGLGNGTTAAAALDMESAMKDVEDYFRG
jgi:hypothetical protein